MGKNYTFPKKCMGENYTFPMKKSPAEILWDSFVAATNVTAYGIVLFLHGFEAFGEHGDYLVLFDDCLYLVDDLSAAFA